MRNIQTALSVVDRGHDNVRLALSLNLTKGYTNWADTHRPNSHNSTPLQYRKMLKKDIRFQRTRRCTVSKDDN